MLCLLPVCIEYLGGAHNFNASGGEHLLQNFYKDPASNSQQRGEKVFMEQLGKNMTTKVLMEKAAQANGISVDGCIDDKHVEANVSNSNIEGDGLQHTFTGSPTYRIDHHKNGCTFEWLKKGTKGLQQVHPSILSWFSDNWSKKIGRDVTSINCYTEMNKEHTTGGGDSPFSSACPSRLPCRRRVL